jgi:hypothetical protein
MPIDHLIGIWNTDFRPFLKSFLIILGIKIKYIKSISTFILMKEDMFSHCGGICL